MHASPHECSFKIARQSVSLVDSPILQSSFSQVSSEVETQKRPEKNEKPNGMICQPKDIVLELAQILKLAISVDHPLLA